MNPLNQHPTEGGISFRLVLCVLVLAFSLPLLLLADGKGPQWWRERGVQNPDPNVAAQDYAAVNQGQLKNIARAAKEELDAKLPGRSGGIITTMVAGWQTPTAQTQDYATVNLGQLKNLARLFYDRLLMEGYRGHPLESGTYPWIALSGGTAPIANDYAVANIGQVKNLFSFDLSNFSGGNGGGDAQAASPSDVAATINADGSITTTWTDNSGGQYGFLIEYSDDGGVTWTELGSVDAGVTQYTNDLPSNPLGDDITIRVNCVNSTGSTIGSPSMSAPLPNKPPAPEIPVLNYAALDMSSTTVSGTAVTVALDDKNNFAYLTKSGTGNAAILSACRYTNGVLDTGFQNSIATYEEFLLYSYCYDDYYDGYSEVNGYCQQLSGPVAITADGVFFVETNWSFYDNEGEGAPGGLGWMRVSNSSLSCADPHLQVPVFNLNDDEDIYEIWNRSYGLLWDDWCRACCSSVSSNGEYTAGICNVGSYTPRYGFITRCGSYGALFSQWGRADYWSQPANLQYVDQDFWPTKINDNGWAIGYDFYNEDDKDADTDTEYDGYVWNGDTKSLISVPGYTTLLDINKQNVVLGMEDADDEGTPGETFLWQNGKRTDLTSLIPQEYQSQLSSVVGYEISNTGTDGIMHILFCALHTDVNTPSHLTSIRTYMLSGAFVPATPGSDTDPGAGPTLSASTCTLQEMRVPDGIGSNNINAQSCMAAIAKRTGDQVNKPLWLRPVSLTNKADPYRGTATNPGHNNKDTDILLCPDGNAPGQSGSTTDIRNVAWIAAHDANDVPRMPQLVASCGSLSGMKVSWKLQVTFYDRYGNPHRDFDEDDPNCLNPSPYLLVDPMLNQQYTSDTPDQVNIPKSGWREITDGKPWEIFNDPDWKSEVSKGFFGGDAVLSLKIESSDGKVILPQQDYNFRIAGENPDQSKCESYINSICNKYWYLYAIARQESSGEGSNSNYNQFLTRGAKYSNRPGKEGIPNWNDDGTDGSYDDDGNLINRWTGTGGYGVLQLTYQASNGPGDTGDTDYIMPRDWIWNWRTNASPAVIKLQQKETLATSCYNWLVANFGPLSIQGQCCPTSGNDMYVFNAYDGILIGRYNGGTGFQKIQSPKDGSVKFSPWKLENGKWVFTGKYTINVAGKL